MYNGIFETDGELMGLLDIFIDVFQSLFGNDFFFFGADAGLYNREGNNGIVSAQCLNYAKRMVFHHEIILDGRLKDISAASIMLPIQRPVVPTGQIIHSMYYGTGLRQTGSES